ncbi:hypothetical protein PR003_g5171 [Phytophthora rubi]|uniref:Uncharacterized protein n=1 Tax=Phytophthora rubi TaxID=129364 RepID=A0A6A3NHS2_9STRA|nr:hypothetical protein PR002_g5228 [Phytophthora rubi]KAE9350829.1 hypothetical protein PR003_g5171 [Phytophthora rubi]
MGDTADEDYAPGEDEDLSGGEDERDGVEEVCHDFYFGEDGDSGRLPQIA